MLLPEREYWGKEKKSVSQGYKVHVISFPRCHVSPAHSASLLVRFRMVIIYSALTQSERLNLGDCEPRLLMFPAQ